MWKRNSLNGQCCITQKNYDALSTLSLLLYSIFAFSISPFSLFFCSVKLTFIHKCLHMFNCTLCEFLLKSQRFFKCMALLQPDINICIEYGCEIYSVNICTIVKQKKTSTNLQTFAYFCGAKCISTAITLRLAGF